MRLIEREQNETLEGVSASQYKSLLKYFLVRLCVAVTLGVLFMAAVEWYSYKRFAHYGENEALEPAVRLDLAASGDEEKTEYWKEFQQANKVLYHQYVLWRRRPYSGRLISINEDGVRRTLNTQCDGRHPIIWMFGDSVMWGAGVSDAETIPSLIAKRYQDEGKPVCIVNYAEKGWSNTQEMLALVELLKHADHRPSMVLFYDGGTEAFAAYQSGQPDVHSNFASFKDFLENWGAKQKASFSYFEETNTYRLLKRIAAKAPFHSKSNQQSGPKLDFDALSEAVTANYIQNIEIVNLLAKQYNFRPIYAWYPNLAVSHKELTAYEQQVLRFQYEEMPDLGSMYQAVYARAKEIEDADFHDLSGAVDDQKDSLYVGLSHMNAKGDQIMAERIFAILERKSSGSVSTTTADDKARQN